MNGKKHGPGLLIEKAIQPIYDPETSTTESKVVSKYFEVTFENDVMLKATEYLGLDAEDLIVKYAPAFYIMDN